MFINTSSFYFSPSLAVNLGVLRIGVGPEIAWAVQATGRGNRYHYNEASFDGDSEHVQYSFYSKRRQVYNRKNQDEQRAYKVNRVMKGINLNADIRVFKTFSVEIKVLYPLTPFIDDFVAFENEYINQTSLNTQLSLKYSFLPSMTLTGDKPKKKRI
jgi:hypothetical protein